MRDTTFATPRNGKNIRFFVSGQTCGQTEDLMIFRHSGEPKKSVFSRVFGSTRKLYAENGDWVPNVALYQTEPHLVFVFGLTGGRYGGGQHCVIFWQKHAFAFVSNILYHTVWLLSSDFRKKWAVCRQSRGGWDLFFCFWPLILDNCGARWYNYTEIVFMLFLNMITSLNVRAFIYRVGGRIE